MTRLNANTDNENTVDLEDSRVMGYSLPRKMDFIAAGVTLAIGFISLLAAYHWFSSPEWDKIFGFKGEGWWIEFGRLVLGVLVTLFLVGSAYRDEASRLLCFRVSPDASDALKHAHRVLLIIGLIAIITMAYYHTVMGPNELRFKIEGEQISQERSWLSDPTQRKAYLHPYLGYIGYSFANMIAVLFAIAAVGLMGAIKDVRRVSLSSSAAVHSLDSDHFSETHKELRNARIDFQSHIRRASALMAGLILVIAYERLVGWKTLSDGGKKFAMASYVVMAISVVFVFFSQYVYGDAYTSVLRRSNLEHESLIESEAPITAWKRSRAQFPLVLFVLGILAIVYTDIIAPRLHG